MQKQKIIHAELTNLWMYFILVWKISWFKLDTNFCRIGRINRLEQNS